LSRVVFDPAGGQRVPVRIWARAITEETERQLVRVASQPYVVGHVAAMADAHVSQGIAVGTVFATEHAVVPAALGGDLGCGMSAARIGLDADGLDRRLLTRVVADLGRAIPTGDRTHRGAGVPVPDGLLAPALSTRSLDHAREALARRHLGTLGGGNHFLELDRDADGGLWLLVHSGSRGLGAAIAAHHAKAAGSASPLAALDVRHEAGAAYLGDLAWALAFARENRRRLAARAMEVLADVAGAAIALDGTPPASSERDPHPAEAVDVHHNFVTRERWLDRELLVHRKGAVAVPKGALALIPGSMGTASYLVEGLGCEASFGSCSHGAGRVMSRREARDRIAPAGLARAMRDVVYPEGMARALVEEAPAAYRDVREVLEDQEDLVMRRTRVEPIAVLKG
jgi:tRNA-splicing ligase RtcB